MRTSDDHDATMPSGTPSPLAGAGANQPTGAPLAANSLSPLAPKPPRSEVISEFARSVWVWPAAVTATVAVIGQLVGAWAAAMVIAVIVAGATGVLARAATPSQPPAVAMALAAITGAVLLVVLWAQREAISDARPVPIGQSVTPTPSASDPAP